MPSRDGARTFRVPDRCQTVTGWEPHSFRVRVTVECVPLGETHRAPIREVRAPERERGARTTVPPTHTRRTGADLALVPPTCGQAGEQGMRGHAHPRGEPGSRRPSMRWSQETPSMPRAAMQRYAPTAGFIEAASKACAGGGSFRRKREPSLSSSRSHASSSREATGRGSTVEA